MDFAISRFHQGVENIDVIDSYAVGLAKVYISSDGKYIVQEPTLSHNAVTVWNSLMKSIHNSFPHDKSSRNDIIPILRQSLEDESRKTDNFELWKKEKDSIEYYLRRDLVGYAELDVLLNDKHIEDVLGVQWDKPMRIVHRKYHDFNLLETNIKFPTEESMSKLIQRISQNFGEPPNESNPITSFTDENNVRFTFTGNRRVTPDSPTLSIRKPSVDMITIFDLLKDGILTPLSASYLWMIIDIKGFGLVIGTPSSGKTTLINAMFTMSNPNWHYFTIEDALELHLSQKIISRHQTQINSSVQGNTTKKPDFDIFALCKLSLRFRPDFVIVGEVLGVEAEGLFQVAGSGSGCVSSFHATDSRHALTKLESPPFNISKTQTSLLSYILHISWITKNNKKYRRILDIVEPHPIDKDPDMRKKLIKVFWYDSKTDSLKPDSVEELLEKSVKLDQAHNVLGIEDISVDLKKRMAILQEILDHSITDTDEISRKITSYYVS